MKALILAAGFGNRMQPLTNNEHKTLLKVGNTTIIDRIISGLINNGITKVVIVTGYRRRELTDHLVKTYESVEFQFVHNEKYKETNNIYSMALAFEQIKFDDDIVFIESDLIYTPDVIEQAVNSKHANVALVSPYKTGMDGTVVQVSGDKITNIFPPHLQDDNFHYFDKHKTLNVYKFSKEFCVNEFKKLLIYYAKVIDDNCYYELILGILIFMQRQDINCEIIGNDKWAEVDDPNDLMGAEFTFNKKNRLKILEDSFGGYWNYDILDFCFIRNMYFPPQSIISEIKNNLPYLLWSYGSKQAVLNKKLSYVLQCDLNRLLALNGAAQIYPILQRLLADKKALIPSPTFGEYTRILSHAEIYQDDGNINQLDIEEKLVNSDVVVFVNPNNPTGTSVSTEWVVLLAENNPEKLFIVDESFIEFSTQESIITHLEKDALDNVLVIKSMSKNYGLPGARLGFVYSCNKGFLSILNKDIPIWNMNSVAEFYLEILLKNKSKLAMSFEDTIRDREELSKLLTELVSVEFVYPSEANFLLVRMTSDQESKNTLVKHLLSHDSIYVKEVTNKIMCENKRHFRIAVRLPDENRKLVEAIKCFEKLK